MSTQVVYFLGWAFGFDERLLEGHWLIAVPELARGPSNTVLAISLLRVALGTAVYGRRTHGFVLAVSGVVAAFALLPLVHLIGSLWAAAPYEGMSAPTILSLLVLSGARCWHEAAVLAQEGEETWTALRDPALRVWS